MKVMVVMLEQKGPCASCCTWSKENGCEHMYGRRDQYLPLEGTLRDVDQAWSWRRMQDRRLRYSRTHVTSELRELPQEFGAV